MKIMICEGSEDKAKVLADLLNVYQFKLVKVPVGADFVKQNKGRIERVALEPDISTTKIIERIGRLYYEKC